VPADAELGVIQGFVFIGTFRPIPRCPRHPDTRGVQREPNCAASSPYGASDCARVSMQEVGRFMK
jgi:hypothetical protein